jgi:hypothetical protein
MRLSQHVVLKEIRDHLPELFKPKDVQAPAKFVLQKREHNKQMVPLHQMQGPKCALPCQIDQSLIKVEASARFLSMQHNMDTTL